MKKTRVNTVLKWLCMAFICCWGLSAFFLLASDVNPYKNVSAEMFVWLKVFSVVSLLLCCWVGKILFNAGLLPDELEEY